MKRIALGLVILLGPVVLALCLGLAGCGDDNRSHGYRDRDQDVHQRPDGDRR